MYQFERRNKLKCIFDPEEELYQDMQFVGQDEGYLCETEFSCYAATVTKRRNEINAAPGLRIQLTNIKAKMKRIYEEKRKTTLRIEKCNILHVHV
jgi:hypothetical protein